MSDYTHSNTDRDVVDLIRQRPGNQTQLGAEVAGVHDEGTHLNVALSVKANQDPNSKGDPSNPYAPSPTQLKNLDAVGNGLKQALGQAPAPSTAQMPKLTDKERRVLQRVLGQIKAKTLSPTALRAFKGLAHKLGNLIPQEALNKLEAMPRPTRRVFENHKIEINSEEGRKFALRTEGVINAPSLKGKTEPKEERRGDHASMKKEAANQTVQLTHDTLYADEMSGKGPSPENSDNGKKSKDEAAAAQQAAMKRWTAVSGIGMAMDLTPN